MKKRPLSAGVEGAAVLAQLRDILAELYLKETETRQVIAKAGLTADSIPSSTDVQITWHNILAEAARAHRLDALLDAVLAQYPDHPPLLAAYSRYRRVLDQGDRMEPPLQPPATDGAAQPITAGNEVGGDKITIGNIQDAIGVAIGTGATSIVTIEHPVSREDRRNQRNHSILRQAVRRFWIDDYLNHSLYNELLIRLGMESRPEAVEHRPWNLALYQAGQIAQTLPLNTRILDVFDATGQRLLILGDPGSGKTITLLELARDLLGRVGADPTYASPVVFNLSSWAERRQPLAHWLVEELNIRYGIPKKVAQDWVTNDELLLLLDGLDEVKPEYREACVEAIHQFHLDHLAPMAVCSRTTEYEALSAKLKLQGAVVLEPLTPDRIEVYLDKAGTDLSALRAALHQDPDLYSMASSALLLNVMTIVYRNASTVDLVSLSSAQARYQHLFATYIRHMLFTHREVRHIYAPRKTLGWLQWLAARLVQHGQTVFLIERMQPTWLKDPNRKGLSKSALMLLWGPLYGIVGGLAFGIVFGLLFGLTGTLLSGLVIILTDGLLFGLTYGMVGGLVFGLIGGLIGGYREIRPVELSDWLWQKLRSGLWAALFWAITGGLIVGLVEGPAYAMILGLVLALLGGLIGGFREIKPVELSGWTWGKLRTNLYSGLGFGLMVGLAFAAVVGILAWVAFGLAEGLLLLNGLVVGLVGGLVIGLVGGLVFGLLFEPSPLVNVSDAVMTRTPNQGVKLSVRYAVTAGLSVGLVVGIAGGLIAGPMLGLDKGPADVVGYGLAFGLVFGLVGGLISGLIGGGDIATKHCLLRLILYLKRRIPWDYAKFLDHCVERIFLRRVGGGYIFVHRLLMEHLAAMTEQEMDRLVEEAPGHERQHQA